jgi:methionine synthase I (cobalamin-dependent)
MARPNFQEFVLDAQRRGKLILMDGPLGTELQQSGLEAERELSYTWNASHPNSVMVVHEDYTNAGADVLLTNTFSAHVGIMQGDPAWPGAVAEAIELARQPEWDHLYCLGSVGSLVGPDDQALEAAAQVMQTLGKCDGVLLETQTRIDRVTRLLHRFPAATKQPLMISWSFSRLPGEENPWVVETIQGELRRAEDVGTWARQHQEQIFALGANCGNNLRLQDFLTTVRGLRSQVNLPLMVRPGITPTLECEFTPQEYAAQVRAFADAGATLLGGCCGTRPAHIAALRQEIDRLGLGWNADT